MLKVEMIKFDVQDIITTSGDGVANGGSIIVTPSCTGNGHNMSFQNINGTWQMACSNCGYSGTAKPGDTVVGGK